MKVLHVPYAWFPDPCGGTEVYVQALAAELSSLGWQSEIAVASPKVKQLTAEDRMHMTIYRVPASSQISQAELYGAGSLLQRLLSPDSWKMKSRAWCIFMRSPPRFRSSG